MLYSKLATGFASTYLNRLIFSHKENNSGRRSMEECKNKFQRKKTPRSEKDN